MNDTRPALGSDGLVTAECKVTKTTTGARVVDSDALLAGAAQLAIRHRETIYFLRQTRFGKLILTK
jgi:hemin uptake protein HemP